MSTYTDAKTTNLAVRCRGAASALLVSVTLTVILTGAVTGGGTLSADQRCRRVFATVSAQIMAGPVDCPDNPPFHLCAVASVRGWGLNGDYTFAVDAATDFVGATTTQAVTGDFTFTPRRGPGFTGEKTVLFDPINGTQATIYQVDDGTVRATFYTAGAVQPVSPTLFTGEAPFWGVICSGE